MFRESESDEPTLIQAAKQGDLEAFNLLILHYQDLLFNIALQVVGDGDLAADAVQCALISAFRKFSQLRGERSEALRSWLARMVLNACYDELRRERRRRENPLFRVDADEDEIDSASWLVDLSPGPEERLEMTEWDRALQDCILSLKPVFRVTLVMIDMEGMSYEEAALAAGVPMGTVKSRLARARLALRDQLQNIPGLLPDRWGFEIPQHEPVGERCP